MRSKTNENNNRDLRGQAATFNGKIYDGRSAQLILSFEILTISRLFAASGKYFIWKVHTQIESSREDEICSAQNYAFPRDFQLEAIVTWPLL